MRDSSELFAEYFSNVYSPDSNNFQAGNTANASTYFDINIRDIQNVVSNMDEFKTNSPDGIPSIFYKRTIDSLATPLLIIFKKCLVEMKYPTKWKLSYITPIFKAGDISKVENYRPISILPAISKIFDKLIYEHIRSRVEHLISLKQHGFTRSTLTNLLEFVDYITRNIIRGGSD